MIQLSPVLEERIVRAAKQKGIEPEKLVEKAVDKLLAEDGGPQVSEARRKLRELAKYKKPVVDFDAAVHQAKRRAGQLLEDNADWIEHVTSKGTKGR
ncbi:MAG: hypothetical protein HY782_04930 [Chloroflexi bacterium]|nr:hypothetical protein [Chloroflexota bacterium]